jgi:sugar (pentulose or hexulose) kinase
MTRYLIGIDNGSQSSKVAIFDEHGTIICEGRQALRPNDTPHPGVVEHPEDDLWSSIGEASRRAMDLFPGKLSDIVGVGLCTIRFCRALLKADGSLAQPVMSWMDARVSRPYEPTNAQVRYVTTSSGYISQRFTGQFKDTAANYQGMWPIDTNTWDWTTDETELARCGIPRQMLFDLVMPGDTIGHVTAEAARHTGIPEGLPVVATANDKAVEALGCGLRSSDTLLVSLGTYIAGMTVGERNVLDASNFWTNFACRPHEYLYESSGIRRGMWTVSWFRELLGQEAVAGAEAAGLTVEHYLNVEAAKVPAGCDGLMTVLDWLAPTDAPYKKGSILGFDGRQGRFHIYRSILEAIALTIHRAAVEMRGELGVEFEGTIISGGGSSSDLMMQIFADVFGIPAVRTRVNNSAGLGSAICAAVGLGVYESFDQAIANMVEVGATFEPDPVSHATYQELGAVYDEIPRHTEDVFKKSYEIFG